MRKTESQAAEEVNQKVDSREEVIYRLSKRAISDFQRGARVTTHERMLREG